jgi:alkylated DNA repair dioxygenase AlkB
VSQIDLLPSANCLPPGLIYQSDFITAGEEASLVAGIKTLNFSAPTMRGVPAKRRTVHFGRSYEFDTFKLGDAPPLPHFLKPFRERAAILTSRAPEEFMETLVTEYSPGAGIGWHRDAPPFGIIVGLSLVAPCTMKFRPWPVVKSSGRRTKPLAQLLEPRSVYVLEGEVRQRWQHYIPPGNALRYSITFRTLRG